jgi:hypothetical protein
MVKQQLTTAKKATIVGLRESKTPYKQFMLEYGLSNQRIQLIMDPHDASGSIEMVNWWRWRRNIISIGDWLTMTIVLCNRGVASPSAKGHLGLPNLSHTTLCRLISEVSESKFYWKLVKLDINKAQATRRVIWCKQHWNWIIDRWLLVIWSDESSFK